MIECFRKFTMCRPSDFSLSPFSYLHGLQLTARKPIPKAYDRGCDSVITSIFLYLSSQEERYRFSDSKMLHSYYTKTKGKLMFDLTIIHEYLPD